MYFEILVIAKVIVNGDAHIWDTIGAETKQRRAMKTQKQAREEDLLYTLYKNIEWAQAVEKYPMQTLLVLKYLPY